MFDNGVEIDNYFTFIGDERGDEACANAICGIFTTLAS
jgi:hypothetical protein